MNAFDFEYMNWVALAVAIVANFVIGFVWYAGWFPTGKMWMGYMGMDPKAKPDSGEMMKGLVMMLVGSFLMMLALGLTVGKKVSGGGITVHQNDVGELMGWALLFWMGFMVPQLLGSLAWEKRPMGLVAINGGYQLVNILVAGLIFATL